MQAYVAEIGEIVRSQRRDEEELEQLQERISFVVKELAGQRRWLKLFPYLGIVSKTLYYSSTLLSGTQTLGEEYVHLFETAGLKRAVPSWIARFCFVVLHVFAPLFAQHLIKKAQRRLNHPSTSTFLGIPIRNNPKARKTFQDIVEWLRSTGIPGFRRVHLAFFYIFGAYYNISRRFTGIRFLSLSPQTELGALKVYRILGYLTLAQTSISIAIWLICLLEEERKQSLRSREQTSTSSSTSADSGSDKSGNIWPHSWFRCAVCLENNNPSCAPCGHLFCWNCIQEHAISSESEPKCPQCRTVFDPALIVPLLNL